MPNRTPTQAREWDSDFALDALRPHTRGAETGTPPPRHAQAHAQPPQTEGLSPALSLTLTFRSLPSGIPSSLLLTF